jgi:hypothetical protein
LYASNEQQNDVPTPAVATIPPPQHLSDVLELARASFRPELVDAPAYERLSRVCAGLPASLSTFWGVETRLGDDRPVVDLLVEIKRGAPGHKLLRGDQPSSLDDLVARWPAWRQVRDFAHDWSESGDGGYAHLRNLWLEFDTADTFRNADLERALGRPCVFWGPHDDVARSPGFFDELARLVDRFYPLWVAPDRLDAMVAALPAGANVFQIGAMGSREQAVLRLCVNRLDPAGLRDWLAAIAWPGDQAALGETLNLLQPMIGGLAVDMDVTAAGVAQKIGFECYLDWEVEQIGQWGPLLDHLRNEGLLTDGKRRALAAFPGRGGFPLRQQLGWMRDGVTHPLLIRNIHHIKLNFRDTALHEAKGYLGLYRPGVRFTQLLRPHDDATAPSDTPDGWYIP